MQAGRRTERGHKNTHSSPLSVSLSPVHTHDTHRVPLTPASLYLSLSHTHKRTSTQLEAPRDDAGHAGLLHLVAAGDAHPGRGHRGERSGYRQTDTEGWGRGVRAQISWSHLSHAVAESPFQPSLQQKVEKAKLSVRISCLPMDADRRYPRPPSLPPIDPYFDEAQAMADYHQRLSKAEEKVSVRLRRGATK